MNVMANQSANSLESLKFYVVTSSWFAKAWPILMEKPSNCNNVVTDQQYGDNWKEYIGRIYNEELVHQRMGDKSSVIIRMKLGLVHTKDFFLLGPQSWMLVKQKFGYDIELFRCCKKLVSPQNGASQGQIELAFTPEEIENNNNIVPSVVIPPTGRFPYEMVISVDKIEKVGKMASFTPSKLEIDEVVSLS